MKWHKFQKKKKDQKQQDGNTVLISNHSICWCQIDKYIKDETTPVFNIYADQEKAIAKAQIQNIGNYIEDQFPEKENTQILLYDIEISKVIELTKVLGELGYYKIKLIREKSSVGYGKIQLDIIRKKGKKDNIAIKQNRLR